MFVKFPKESEHVANLQKLFRKFHKYWLKLNLAKFTFGATSDKLLGLIISKKGIEVDPDKVKGI